MSKDEKIVFCTGGGCTAKLGAGVLSRILEKLPRGEKDPNLLVGYDSRDDAAVYRVTEGLALVQTVDFFPPMVDDPYTFGQIAAANALSDVYAMGGEVKTALNLVCFPENMDLNVLGEILRGGAEKVAEAGGILAGGHSIADTGVKYGLSVTGLVDPHHLYANDAGQPGDKLLLTNFFNFTQPFIRYEVTDRIILHNELCACGNPSPWIEIEGRNDDVLTFTEGEKVIRVPPLAVYATLKEVPCLRRFQLVVDAENRMELRLDVDADSSKADAFAKAAAALREFFHQYGIKSIDITLSPDNPQQHPESGKFKHIINRVKE